jgi:hypothetical protein
LGAAAAWGTTLRNVGMAEMDLVEIVEIWKIDYL